MNIVVVVRTRDEEKRIGKFCEAYKDADTIIVADGGSIDNTVSIASQYKNVVLRPFNERVELNKGMWRNNDAAHANFLVAQAKTFNPDWVIYDDCDCRPNFLLKQDYRKILEETTENIVCAVRFYFWNTDEWFPQMSSPAGNLEPTLWAWKGNLDFGFINVPPAYCFRINGNKVENLHAQTSVKDLYPPYALLHYSWNEETVAYKIRNYADSGFIPGYVDPRQFAGPRRPIEEYMHE